MKSETDVRPPSAPADLRTFTVRLSATRHGARLARFLAVRQLDAWGIAHTGEVASAVAVVTAEFAANAVTHGRLAGRDFELRLLLLPKAVRVEASDARPERPLPEPGAAASPPPESDGGRGLLLVDALADRWGCQTRDALVKTAWAEIRRAAPPEAPGR